MTSSKLPPLFNKVIQTNTARKNIIDAINKKFITLNSASLSTLVDNTTYSNPIRDPNADITIIDSEKIGLANIYDKIGINSAYWQPVMQIARSSRGDGTVNKPKGTATTITMYNNESIDNFFTEADTKNDEKGVPLCYWGNNLDNPDASNNVANKAPDSPPFRIYSKQDSKPGALLVKPDTTRGDTSILYYQFTFPYNCYVYMVVNAALDWSTIEGGGRPSVFMITDENENTVIARTSHDDGNGKNDKNNPSKNRPYAVIHWHGYVKKGWKLYYVEQESSLTGGPSHGKNGHCCVVFKADNTNNYNFINNIPVLSLSKFSTSDSYYNGNDITLSIQSNEALSNFVVQNESKLTNLLTESVVPITPIFYTYSIKDSKPGEIFPAPGSQSRGFWATIKIPYDCHIDFSLMGVYHENDTIKTYEKYSIYAIMIYDNNNNKVIAKTSCDDGNGNNTDTATNRCWGNLHYTGIVKRGYRVYFACISKHNVASEICINGLLLNLYKLQSNVKYDYSYTNVDLDYNQHVYSGNNALTNEDEIINTSYNTDSANITDLIKAANTFSSDKFPAEALSYASYYTMKEAMNNGIAIISIIASVQHSVHRIHSAYIITDSLGKVKDAKYCNAYVDEWAVFHTDSNAVVIKVNVNKNDKIYIFVEAADTRFDFATGIARGFASVTIISI